MITNKKNILQLVALMQAYGIKDVVLCPGSRNAPLVHAFSHLEAFRCHAVTDERSAGFFAIGLALETGHPAAVCVTSGSALLNVHPACAEAFYQGVPLVVISADRPASWIGQMDGQTMPQHNAFGSMVRCSVTLLEVHTSEDEWHVNRLVNEALLACRHHGFGPVHINVPISEPLYEFTSENLPEVRVIKRLVSGHDDMTCVGEDAKNVARRLLVLGQSTIGECVDTHLLQRLSRHFVIVAEHLSNVCDGSIVLRNVDGLLGDINHLPAHQQETLSPQLVVTMGGHIVSKQLKRFLRCHRPEEHWHVSADGRVADLFMCQTQAIESGINAILQKLADVLDAEHQSSATQDYLARWHALAHASYEAETASEHGLAERSVEVLLSSLPHGAVLHLANSSAVRYAQRFALDASVTVCCNRGINGIEGSMSSAVGYAASNPLRPNFLVIGDLSFFYDQNALWNTCLPQNLHVLLLNSGGGRIFDTLPVPRDERTRSFVCATHTTRAQQACMQYGLKYLTAHDELALRAQIDELVKSDVATLFEVVTTGR